MDLFWMLFETQWSNLISWDIQTHQKWTNLYSLVKLQPHVVGIKVLVS